jgi:hypothetical protein
MDPASFLEGLSTETLIDAVGAAIAGRPTAKATLLRTWLEEDGVEALLGLGTSPPQDPASSARYEQLLASYRTLHTAPQVEALPSPPEGYEQVLQSYRTNIADNYSDPKALPASRLTVAVDAGDFTEVRKLVEAKADVNALNENGISPAALAVKGSRPSSLLEYLLNNGAEVVAPSQHEHSLLQAWTVAFVDVKPHGPDVKEKLRLLLQAKADIDERIGHTGDTPLHLAARNFNSHREKAGTPTMSRHTQQRFEAAKFKFKLLLEAKANASIRNSTHKTAMDLVDSKYRRELQPAA